jgi:hypothetical protein
VKPRIVVLGIMGRTPFAGVAWQALHYLEALRRLGGDVHYVEDTGEWAYDADRETFTDDHAYPVRYLQRLMDWVGLGDRWAYRAGAAGGEVFGLSKSELDDIVAGADALINLTGATVLRDEHLHVPTRIYLETDPVLPQVEVARGRAFTIELLGAHTHHFTFGENLGTQHCPIPTERFAYRHTRQPVVLDWWRTSDGAAAGAGARRPHGTDRSAALRFTTVASWHQTGKDVEWNGRVYAWSKHHQFAKFIALPQHSRVTLELALTRADSAALADLAAHGWRVADAVALSREHLPYRDYILGSDGEFTVAKDQYVLPRSGWFSDRSASYLAAGKPVVTQDTGFGRVLPTGRGLFAFQSMDDILGAFDAIAADPASHAKAAQEIAAEFFDAERVVGRLLAAAGL